MDWLTGNDEDWQVGREVVEMSNWVEEGQQGGTETE